MVGFFEHQAHFGGETGLTPGAPEGPIFGGGGGDTVNQVGSEHPDSEFRNKIIDQIEQFVHEACGKIKYHITIIDDVIFLWFVVKRKKRLAFGARRLAGRGLTQRARRSRRFSNVQMKSGTIPLPLITGGVCV